MVEEHSICSEVVPVRDGGADGSENVGMSNKKFCENQNHRKSKGSWATVIDPGLGGPNHGITKWYRGMEEQVNIPVLADFFASLTHLGEKACYGYVGCRFVRSGRKRSSRAE